MTPLLKLRTWYNYHKYRRYRNHAIKYCTIRRDIYLAMVEALDCDREKQYYIEYARLYEHAINQLTFELSMENHKQLPWK